MIGPAHYIPHPPANRRAWLAGILLGLAYVSLASCAQEARHAGPPIDNLHNTVGGYIPACEDKPGLEGDDC